MILNPLYWFSSSWLFLLPWFSYCTITFPLSSLFYRFFSLFIIYFLFYLNLILLLEFFLFFLSISLKLLCFAFLTNFLSPLKFRFPNSTRIFLIFHTSKLYGSKNQLIQHFHDFWETILGKITLFQENLSDRRRRKTQPTSPRIWCVLFSKQNLLLHFCGVHQRNLSSSSH